MLNDYDDTCFFCCFVVCACELVWSALKFVYISCLCVCVYASRQTKTTSSVIAHLNRFSTRFIWNCDTRTRNAHKHTSRALNSLTRLEKKWKLVIFERMNENERDEFYDKSFSPCFASHVAALSTSENWRDQECDWWKKKICSMFAFMTHFFLINSQ